MSAVTSPLFKMICGVLVGVVACGPGHMQASDGDEQGGTVGGADGSSGEPTPTGSTTADSPTGGGEQGGTTGGSTDDSTAETGEPIMPMMPMMPELPEACALVRVAGDARVAVDADWMHAVSVTVLHAGDPQTPARVMTIQNEGKGEAHGNYRARAFTLGSWPEGVSETQPSLALTRSGHAVSRLARIDEGSGRFAYLWIGDPRGDNKPDTFFSILDADAWSVGGEVEVVHNSNFSFIDLLRAPSSGRFVSTHTIDAFDTTPKDQASGFSLGLLDGTGVPMGPPTPLTSRTPAPGSELRSFWAGDRVAVAMGHNACDMQDPLCSPHAVVLARTNTPDDDGLAVEGFESTLVIEGRADTQHISRPLVAAEHGLTWVTWYEGEDPSSSNAHRTFRGLVLDASGDPLAWPPDDPAPGAIEFLVDTDMASWPSLRVSDLGITAVVPRHDSTYEVRHHDFGFRPLGEPIVIELPGAGAGPSMVMLDAPRALLLAWSEQVGEEGAVEMRMVQLECASSP